jgi:hypothetical protein
MMATNAASGNHKREATARKSDDPSEKISSRIDELAEKE